MRARIPRPPLAVESSHCLTLNIMRPLSRSAAASSVLGVFRMLCISNFGVRNWPLVLVPGVNPFGRPELRCSGQCGDLNPLNPARSTQCPAQNPKSSCISSFLASLLVSALRLLAHLSPAPPRSSRPCAVSLISALRLLGPFLRLEHGARRRSSVLRRRRPFAACPACAPRAATASRCRLPPRPAPDAPPPGNAPNAPVAPPNTRRRP